MDRVRGGGPALERAPTPSQPCHPRAERTASRRTTPRSNGSFKEIGSETSRERAAELSLTEAGYTGLSGRIQKLYATDEFLGTT